VYERPSNPGSARGQVLTFKFTFAAYAEWSLGFAWLRDWAEMRSSIGECRTDFQSVCPATDCKSVLQNVAESQTHSLLSVLSIHVSAFSSNGANQPAHDRFVNNSFGCYSNDDWNLIGHQSVAEKSQLPSISWSCPRNHGLGQRHTAIKQGGDLPRTSCRPN